MGPLDKFIKENFMNKKLPEIILIDDFPTYLDFGESGNQVFRGIRDFRASEKIYHFREENFDIYCLSYLSNAGIKDKPNKLNFYEIGIFSSLEYNLLVSINPHEFPDHLISANGDLYGINQNLVNLIPEPHRDKFSISKKEKNFWIWNYPKKKGQGIIKILERFYLVRE